MSSNLSSQISRYGVSESFSAFIEGLRDTPGISEKKFRREDVNKVAQYLVCRNYGKACLELSYLAWAVVNYPTNTLANAPLIEFFWLNESISPKRFRQAFSEPFQDNDIQISLNKDGLQLQLSTSSFTISPTRVGVLAVLLEVLTTLAPQQLSSIEQQLKGSLNNKPIKALSSEFQKQIYQYLAEHLIPAQQQRRYRYVTQWLDQKHKQQLLAPNELLSDEIILEFWQFSCVDESSPGYKLYASAFHDLLDVEQALKQAKNAIALGNSFSLGEDVDAGEYSPELIQNLLFNDVTEIQDYSWLCQSPKFLTKSQWNFVEPIMNHRAYAKPLLLSFMRLAIFGQWQASLVQAKRKSSQITEKKLNQPLTQSYQIFQGELVGIKAPIQNVILAIIHIFYAQQDSRYLGMALSCLAKEQQVKLKSLIAEQLQDKSLVDNDEALPEYTSPEEMAAANKKLFILSKPILLQSQVLQQLINAANKSFKNNNKDGFQSLPEIDLLDDFQSGYDGLASCLQLVNTLISQFTKKWPNTTICEEIFCSDVSIFKGIFEKIYGEVHE